MSSATNDASFDGSLPELTSVLVRRKRPILASALAGLLLGGLTAPLFGG
ncbi:MAG: hypothetical protein HQK87_05220, partial [Nitrospinae bacterium]|nr:hypothetical protein [Nitrospinota bacterium]